MTNQSRNPHVAPVAIELERTLPNSKAATASSMLINEIKFVAKFTRARFTDDLWQDNLDVLPEKALDGQVQNESKHEVIDKDVAMPENKLIGRSDYT